MSAGAEDPAWAAVRAWWKDVLQLLEGLGALSRGGARPGLIGLGLNVEVKPGEPGLAIRAPRGLECDHPGDAFRGRRRVSDPRRVLQEHRLDGEAAGRRVIEQLTKPPGVLWIIDEEA